MPFLAAIPAIAAIGSAAASAGGAIAAGAGAAAAAAGTAVAGLSTASAISLGATALSAGVGAVSAINSANASSANAKYQAQVATNNQTIANQNATLADQQAGAKVQSDYRVGAIKLGAQRAAMGAAGGTIDSGSAADVQSNTAEYTALGASNDQYQGNLTAYGYRAQSANYGAQSTLDTQEAGQATTAGMIGAGNSLLTGASQFGSKWAQYQGSPTAVAA